MVIHGLEYTVTGLSTHPLKDPVASVFGAIISTSPFVNEFFVMFLIKLYYEIVDSHAIV